MALDDDGDLKEDDEEGEEEEDEDAAQGGNGEGAAEQMRSMEEYRIWKKNAPFLYDCVVSHALEWPSLTVQWLPDRALHDGKEAKDRYTVQRLLLGTHTSAVGDANAAAGGAAAAASSSQAAAAPVPQNYLLFAEVRLPRPDGSSSAGAAANGSSSSLAADGVYGRAQGRIDIVQRIPHAGEVNRARYAPFNPDLIATKSPSSTLCVFDRSKHPSRPDTSSGSGSGIQARPDLLLQGHTEEGYGLQWNPHAGERGCLLSGSNDGLVCMWNVEQASLSKAKSGTGSSGGAVHAAAPTLPPLRTFRAHTDVVEDVAWSQFQSSIFASCGDDARLLLWDTRADEQGGSQPVAALNDPSKARSSAALAAGGGRGSNVSHHTGNINCVGFNPFSEHVLASGGSDGVVLLWDLRSMAAPLHALRAQAGAVAAASNDDSSPPLHFFNLSWSPFSGDLLLATDGARRAYIWDVSRIGSDEDGSGDGDEGEAGSDGLPSSLLFVHGGHTERIGDACWNSNEGEEWMVASVADDNVLQIWQVSESVYGDEGGSSSDAPAASVVGNGEDGRRTGAAAAAAANR